MHAIDRDSAPEKPCADVALVPRGMVWRRPPARRALLAGVLAALMAVSAQAQELIPPTASGWNAFAPRGETAPGMDVSLGAGGYSLNIYGNGVPSVYGGWKTRIEGLQGLSYFRFRARALPLNIGSLRESVTLLLGWTGSFGSEVAPDYVWDFRPQSNGTILFDRVIQAPSGTTAVELELLLQWSPSGRVTFDQLSFTAAAPPPSRRGASGRDLLPPVGDQERAGVGATGGRLRGTGCD